MNLLNAFEIEQVSGGFTIDDIRYVIERSLYDASGLCMGAAWGYKMMPTLAWAVGALPVELFVLAGAFCGFLITDTLFMINKWAMANTPSLD